MPAWLPATLESAIETMIAYSITAVDNKPATASIIITTTLIEANPTARSCFSFSG
jgi:hypothetical protein